MDPDPPLQPDQAIHAIGGDLVDLAIEPGRALALRQFGPSKQNPAPGDEPVEDR